jgi:GTP-binding protein
MSHIVAIIGRPNVGKSTLFNRLVGGREAIVDEISGVTRDRHYGVSIWGDKSFTVIDTGGYIHGSDDAFEGEIRGQVKHAIEEANAVIFMVDVTTGITDLDMEVAKLLRKAKKPVYVCANKVDNFDRIHQAAEFYSLGLGDIITVSAINGSGTGELLDKITEDIEPVPEKEELDLPKFAVVGRPNVGKSSLMNLLLGENRSIVTPIAGTTRDSIDQYFSGFGFEFIMIDTAGLRKKTKVTDNLEFYSVMRTIKAIERCDVCILMIDAQEGLQAQDVNILHLVERNNKGVVVVVNKWDLVEKDTKTSLAFEEAIRRKTQPFTDYPIIFTSVTEKQRVHKVLDKTMQVYKNRFYKIKTSVLNDKFLPILKNTPPPTLKGRQVGIKYITQLPTSFPSFAIFCNLPQYVKEPYKRFAENKMREMFSFEGNPVRLYFRKK